MNTKNEVMGTLVKSNNKLFPTIPSLFDDFFARDLFNLNNLNQSYGDSLPSTNIKEMEDHFEVEVAAPGMSKNDFHVELDNDTLIISAHRENQREEKDKDGNYTRREFSYQNFSRSFSLPERMVQGEKISAKYRDGILQIMIPKTEEAKTKPARQIRIS
jgi:HSP20 family protein